MKKLQIAAITAALATASVLILAGCGERPSLPTSIDTNPEDFGANDTSFVRITPDWDAAHGYDFTRPGDLLMGMDGFFYVADSGAANGRVVQMKQDGSVYRSDLFSSIADTSCPPQGIGQDSRLNLYMVNGGNQVYVWNQYVKKVGIRYLVQGFTLRSQTSDDSIVVDNASPLYAQLPYGWSSLFDTSYVLDQASVLATENPDSLALWANEYVFYSESDTARPPAIFSDVDGGPLRSGQIFVSDQSADDRILVLDVMPARMMVLNDGSLNYVYRGRFRSRAVGFGQGQASTNTPTSVVTTGSGSNTNLYFTQTAGSFLVQRVKVSGTEWLWDINPLGDPDVLQLGYFRKPMAIAVGESDSRGLGLFYVADQKQDRVTAFYPNGHRFREVAVDEQLIDLDGGDSLSTVLAAEGDTLDPTLNPSLVDFVAARRQVVALDSLEALADALAGMGQSFDPALNDTALAGFVAPRDTSVSVFFAADTTVRVYFPILNGPTGVETLEGVVYIADTENDRILRFRRSDSNSYIPNDPNYP